MLLDAHSHGLTRAVRDYNPCSTPGSEALALFQFALQLGAYRNAALTWRDFLAFAKRTPSPLDITNIDIALYVSLTSEQGTVAANSLQSYLYAINKFLLNHGKPPVTLGQMITGVRKGLANCQGDLAPRRSVYRR